MGQQRLEHALAMRNPPRDPPLHNDHAGNGDQALKGDDFLLEKLRALLAGPMTFRDGQQTPAPDMTLPQQMFQKLYDSERGGSDPKNTIFGGRVAIPAPPDYQLKNFHPIKDQ